MEFKGTKGQWKYRKGITRFYIETVDQSHQNTFIGDIGGGLQSEDEIEANALLVSCAPEMLEILKEAKVELSRIKNSIMAHPDCTVGSEFDDYTDSAQEMEDKIFSLIKKATEL